MVKGREKAERERAGGKKRKAKRLLAGGDAKFGAAAEERETV